MKTVSVKLDANGRAQDMAGGWVFICESLSAGDEVTLTWLVNGREERGVLRHVSPGRRYKPGFYFDGFQLNGTAGAEVVMIIGGENADADLFDTEALAYITNPDADPVPVNIINPVTLTASSVTVTANGVAVSDAAPFPIKSPGTLPVQEQLPSAIANVAPVAVTAVIGALLALDATRRGFVARNAGDNAVAFVAAGGSYANAALVLQPGEIYREESVPGAAWFAICEAGVTSTVNLLKW
jgi:hypothetical protein